MKILLVRSRYILPDYDTPRYAYEPLGLEYLASAVRKNHKVEIFDSIAEGWNAYTPTDNRENFFYQGAELNKLKKKIDEFKPDTIGVNWIFSTQNKPIIETINFIKEHYGKIPLIVGGAGPSANPVQIMKENPNIDIAVFGEGEITLRELLDKGLKDLDSVEGIVFRKGGDIIQNQARALVENIDTILLPHRDAVPYRDYPKQMLYAFLASTFKNKENKGLTVAKHLSSFCDKAPFLEKTYYQLHNKKHPDNQYPVGDIMTSRGCPNNCSFCAVHIIWKRIWRPHSVDRVLEEIEELVSKYKVKRINILDDNFNLSKERIIKICQGVVKNKYNITFNSDATYTPALDEKVLIWLKKAGFKSIRLSIESGNQEILDKVVGKRIDLSKVPDIVKIAHRYGIKMDGTFILGLPGETKETMHDTVNFARKAGFDNNKFFIYQPFPYTRAYEICKDKGYLVKDYNPELLYVNSNNAWVKTEDFSPEDVLKIAKEARSL